MVPWANPSAYSKRYLDQYSRLYGADSFYLVLRCARAVVGDNDIIDRCACTFSALTLLVGRQEGRPACKKTEWWGAGVVICLERGADLHTAQLMPLPHTVSCFSEIQIGFTFLVLAYPGSPGQGC